MSREDRSHLPAIPPNDEPTAPCDAHGKNFAYSPSQLAYYQACQLDSKYATIRFTKEFPQDGETTVSNVDVVANLENGNAVVRYRLLPQPTGEPVKAVSGILDAGLSHELSTVEVLKQLAKATESSTTYHWIPEKIDSRHLKEGEPAPNNAEVGPMQRVIPSFHEFVNNPSSLGERFLSARREGSCQYQFETRLDTKNGLVFAELCSTDHARGGQQRYDCHTKVASNHREFQAEDSLRRDLLVLSWTLHEVFWEQGAEALRNLLHETEPPSTPALDDSRNEDTEVRDPDLALLNGLALDPALCDLVYNLPSGAILQFASNAGNAWAQLRSSPDADAGTVAWTFESPEDLSLDETPMRQEIIRALEALADNESDSGRLEALNALNRLRSSRSSQPATLEHLVGPELAPYLADMRAISVTPYSPTTDQDILDLCNGINLLTIRFTGRREKNKPQLFDLMQLGISPTGDIRLMAFNHLQGRCDAFMSSASLDRFDGVHETIRLLCEAFKEQRETGRVALQRRIQEICDVDSDSNWVVWGGDPAKACLPPVNDSWGQETYDLGAKIVKRFSKMNGANPDDSRVSWIKDGRVETTLGTDQDAFLLNLTLYRNVVRRISIFDQERRKIGSYRCNLPIKESDSSMRAVTETVRLFDILLRSQTKGSRASFRRSALFRFIKDTLGGTTSSEG